MVELRFTLPRSAFSPREVARAGDVWRLFQDVAVEGSVASGWPPERYRREGVSFIVRSMVVVHHREAVYGEPIVGRTWPSAFRRGMFFRRECRVLANAEPIASATQEWVTVTSEVSLVKAPPPLVDAFPIETHDASVSLPPFEPIEEARTHRFELDCWHTWMDPLAHVNHPAYVEWCDEATSRAMSEAGLDPVRLQPVAEEARFKSGVVAGERVVVSTRVAGRTERGDVVLDHRISRGDQPAAQVRAVRRLVDDGAGGSLRALV